MAGLDIYKAVGSYLNPDLSTSGEVSSTILDLIDKGRLGMKTGGGLYDYTPEQIDELRAKRAREADRGAQGARGVSDEALDARQRLDRDRPRAADVEHRRRHAGADPVLRRADRARRRALPVRHRVRPRAHRARAAVRVPGADRRADDPGAARALRLRPEDVGTSSTRTCTSTTSAATSTSRGSRVADHEKELAHARNHEPFEFFGYSDKTWDYEGARLRDGLRRRRAREGHWLVRDARPHGRPLLGAGEARAAASPCSSRWTSSTRRPPTRRACSRASTSTRSRASARSAGSRSSPPSTAPRSSSRTTWTPGQPTRRPPSYYDL